MFETTSFSFPLSALLIPFGLFLLFILLYSAFSLYHLLRFGVPSKQLVFVIVLYIIGSTLVLWVSTSLLLTYTWNAPVTFTEFTQDVPTFPL